MATVWAATQVNLLHRAASAPLQRWMVADHRRWNGLADAVEQQAAVTSVEKAAMAVVAANGMNRDTQVLEAILRREFEEQTGRKLPTKAATQAVYDAVDAARLATKTPSRSVVGMVPSDGVRAWILLANRPVPVLTVKSESGGILTRRLGADLHDVQSNIPSSSVYPDRAVDFKQRRDGSWQMVVQPYRWAGHSASPDVMGINVDSGPPASPWTALEALSVKAPAPQRTPAAAPRAATDEEGTIRVEYKVRGYHYRLVGKSTDETPRVFTGGGVSGLRPIATSALGPADFATMIKQWDKARGAPAKKRAPGEGKP